MATEDICNIGITTNIELGVWEILTLPQKGQLLSIYFLFDIQSVTWISVVAKTKLLKVHVLSLYESPL